MTTTSTSSSITLSDIRRHYDWLSPLYARLWGRHLHHGYWRGDETIPRAQTQLMEELAAAAQVPAQARVLDVGCGLGGSSLWLAATRGCQVEGITLSPVQQHAATREAARRGLSSRVRFQVMDANHLNFPTEYFDVVWSIECTEHLHDKAAFFRNAARCLKPGGVMAIAAWLNGENADTPAGAPLVAEIRDAMLCPSFGSLADYQQWMTDAGLTVVQARDITTHVLPTWIHCVNIGRRLDVRLLLPFLGAATRRFVRSFEMMRTAFETRAMTYGLFAARKNVAAVDFPSEIR